MVALILAGHGSHIRPDTAGLVWSYVDQLRACGVADEVTAAFWKEAPAFNQVLDTVQSDQIVIVPVFTAQGYFSKTVIPAEMNLTGSHTIRNGHTIHYTPTLGEHPNLTAIVQQRISAVMKAEDLSADQVTVAIIGHGTPRSRASQDATQQQVDKLSSIAAEVVAVFLDDEPTISSIYETTVAPTIIAVPFFLAEGSHVINDVPHALGIQCYNRAVIVNGRQVYYTPPIGTDETVCQLILDLARSTGLEFRRRETKRVWDSFPKIGGEQLIADVTRAGKLQFGQLTLTPTEVRPTNTEPGAVILKTPAALRQHIREKPFRPLATRGLVCTNYRSAHAACCCRNHLPRRSVGLVPTL